MAAEGRGPIIRREVDEYRREQDPYARQGGDYEVWQSRGPAQRGEARRLYPGEPGKERDFLTSYGGPVGPRGGLTGINYEHDIDAGLRREPGYELRENRYPAVVSRTRQVESYDYPEYERETYSPEYTTERSYVSRSAEPVYASEYVTDDFPSYEYGQASTSYVGATSAVDYIDERRGKSGKRKWNPICDMGETSTYWLVRCEIPGVRKDRLHVEVEGKDLVIKGKRVKELWNLDRLGPAPATATASGATAPAPGAAAAQKFRVDPRMSNVNWLSKERGGKGTFKRRVRLPERVDNSAIQALYKDGILEVLVKKPQGQARKEAKAKAKTVQIQHS